MNNVTVPISHEGLAQARRYVSIVVTLAGIIAAERPANAAEQEALWLLQSAVNDAVASQAHASRVPRLRLVGKGA